VVNVVYWDKFTENWDKFTENWDKFTENWDKFTENWDKFTENWDKYCTNDLFLLLVKKQPETVFQHHSRPNQKHTCHGGAFYG
jgi:hypothetical protein